MDSKEKVFYFVPVGPYEGTFVNINYIVEWKEYNDHLSMHFAAGITYVICRDDCALFYDALLKALNERSNLI